MKTNNIISNQKDIKNMIYTIRGVKVILDEDLSKLYDVKTKRLNEQVKRNFERFPADFMFQLNQNEINNLRSQNATSRFEINLKFQNGTSNYKHGGTRYLPYAFSEHGIAMLSSVLKSKKAIEVNIQIIRAFISMRNFISNNADIFMRLHNIEKKHIGYDKKFEKVFDAIKNKEIKQGIFFNGQVFDAYKFISDLIRTANKSIILIDNFIDDTVLILFSKRKKDTSVKIYTKNITDQLRLDLKKFNSQYEKIEINEFNDSHDRFLIIDDSEIYHIGASLKDLGKKWFAFSKFDKNAFKIIDKLNDKNQFLSGLML